MTNSNELGDEKNLEFSDLFEISEIQKIQDSFCEITGVASIITDVDGNPITAPSNFCRLCNDIIRKTDKGLKNCMRSDAALGRLNCDGPIMQPCLSGGLWDGGASISVGGKHIANWLIGQVRNDTQDDAKMLDYAKEIGADLDSFSSALAEVTVMSTERFRKICDFLYLMAGQLSSLAYKNAVQKQIMENKERLQTELNREILKLKESEGYNKVLFHESRLPLIIMDPKSFKYLDCNRAAAEIYHFDRIEDVIGKTPADVSAPKQLNGEDSGEATKRYISKALQEGSVFFEWRHQRPNGEFWDAEVQLMKLTYHNKEFLQFSLLDITERKNAEKNANEERERLAVTLRSIGDGVITTDVDGKVVLLNKVTEQLTGWTQDEALHHPIQEVFNIVDQETGIACDNPVVKVLTSGQIIELTNHTTLISRNGTRYSIEDSGAPIFNRDSEIIGAVLVFRDVTEKRRTQEELIKIRKLEAVGVLAGGIAHDFNNLLAAILGNIELAEEDTEQTSEVYELLSEAKKASIRATGLTQQLLTFSKGGDPVKKTASISQVVTDSANFILHGSSVICEYRIPDDLWKVDIDTGQISQVIQNIIINARDAMPGGGAIEVGCQNVSGADKDAILLPRQNYIRIVIEDFGSGIPPENLDKIFDPYFSTKKIGSGLGLSICHSIIIKHNGYIRVESEENRGTKFTIYLPASTDAAEDIASPHQDIVEARDKATIMVMDDEALMRHLSKRMITSFGHAVLLAENGHEAIEIYREYHTNDRAIDVVIMDITIPGGMGGKEAVQQILKIDPAAKVIVSSGYANDPVMAHYREYGFKASIAKPFRISELNKLINEVLTEHQRSE
jgi:PAS domain S-box-containing protein